MGFPASVPPVRALALTTLVAAGALSPAQATSPATTAERGDRASLPRSPFPDPGAGSPSTSRAAREVRSLLDHEWREVLREPPGVAATAPAGPPPSPSPGRPAPVRPEDLWTTGDLQVTCEPDVRIYLDGSYRGHASREDGGLYLEGLGPGEHVLEAFRTSGSPARRRVLVRPGETVEVELREREVPARSRKQGQKRSVEVRRGTGKVGFRSVPLRCEVRFLGKTFQKTSDLLEVDGVPEGIHRVEFTREGGKLEGFVGVEAGTIAYLQGHFREGRVLSNLARRFSRAEAGDRLVDELGQAMVWARPGGFRRQDSERGFVPLYGEDPFVRVAVDQGFWIATTETSSQAFDLVMRGALGGDSPTGLPAVDVSWEDATEFCRRLTSLARERGGLPEGWEYRLPTEAEWEYAFLAGAHSVERATWDTNEVAWFRANSGAGPQPGGLKAANRWGLQDMLGNLWEWCADRWIPDTRRRPVDGGANLLGESLERVLRGGSWWDPVSVMGRLPRLGFHQARGTPAFGFRYVAAPRR